MPRMSLGRQEISVTLPRTVSGICTAGGVFTIILGVAVVPNPATVVVGVALVLLGAGIFLVTGK